MNDNPFNPFMLEKPIRVIASAKGTTEVMAETVGTLACYAIQDSIVEFVLYGALDASSIDLDKYDVTVEFV